VTLPAWVRGTLVLIAAVAAGILIGMSYERRRAIGHESASVDGHETDTRHMMTRLERDLKLDSGQHRAISAILARHQMNLDSTWHRMQPQVRATMDSALREILGVLTPDQAATYRKIVESRHPGALR
jgi:hypothetical protein